MKLIDKEKLLEQLNEIQSSTHMSTCISKDYCLGKRQTIARIVDIVEKAQEVNNQQENNPLTLDEVRELKEGDILWLKTETYTQQIVYYEPLVTLSFSPYTIYFKFVSNPKLSGDLCLEDINKSFFIYHNKPEVKEEKK